MARTAKFKSRRILPLIHRRRRRCRNNDSSRGISIVLQEQETKSRWRRDIGKSIDWFHSLRFWSGCQTGKKLRYQWYLDYCISNIKFCTLSDLAGLVGLDNSDIKHRKCLMHWHFCLASLRQQYGDDQTPTITQKLQVSMIFHDWLRHDHAWVVTPWKYNCEKVSGTVRVAQYILHSNFYDIYSSSEMVDYGCCPSRILIDLAVINRDTCSRSTRPLSYTRLF